MIKPGARNIAEFKQVIADSFNENAIFMNAFLLTRFDSDHIISIHHTTMVESCGLVSHQHNTGTVQHLTSLIERRFGIPQNIVGDCLSGLRITKDARGPEVQ